MTIRRHALGKLGRALLVILLLLPSVVLAPPEQALAQGTLVPSVAAATRSDVLFDDARGLLYITSGDSVLRYDVVSNTFISPFKLGGKLAGMDISPDGKTLAVADLTYTGEAWGPGQNWLYLVDLETGAPRQIKFTRDFGETGTWMMAFGSDGKLLTTSQIGGSGWIPLRRVDPVTGTAVILDEVRHNTALEASGDRSIIAFAEANTSDGPWGVYKVATGQLVKRDGYTNGTSSFNYEVTVNRDGTHYGIPTGNMKVYDTTYSLKWGFGVPRGAQYSPTASILYVPATNTGSVIAYETTNYQEVARYDFATVFSTTSWAAQAFAWPRLTASRDNMLLFSTVQTGVRSVWLKPVVTGRALSGSSTPIEGATVEIWRESPTGWVREGTTTTGVGGSWRYAPDSVHNVRVRIIDGSGAHAPVWFGGSDVSDAADILPSTEPVPRILMLPLASAASIQGTVTSSWDARSLPGVQVTLYQDTTPAQNSVATTTTGVDGKFTFGGLAPSRYRLSFNDPSANHRPVFYKDAATLQTSSLVRIVAPGVTKANQQMEFIPFQLKGSIRSSFGNVPVPGAMAEVYKRAEDATYTFDRTVTVDAAGNWTMAAADAAPRRIRAVDPSDMHDPTWYGGTEVSSATDLTPTRGASVPAAAVEMWLARAGSIAGSVRSSLHAAPVAGVRVTLYHDVVGLPAIQTTETAIDGTYRLNGLGPSGFKIGFSDPSGAHSPIYHNGATTLAAATRVVIGSASQTDVDAILQVIPLKASGRVLSSTSGAVVRGANLEVWREQADGEWAVETILTADSTAAWSFSTPLPSRARVRLTDPSGMHGPMWYGGTSLETASDLPMTRGTAATVNITMALTNPGALAGTLTSARDGTPIGGARTMLWRVDANNSPTIVAYGTTASDGTYRFDGLGPLRYDVGFEDLTGKHETKWRTTTGIDITAPGTVPLSTTLIYVNPSVEGKVTSASNGVPIGGVSVEVWSKNATGAWVLGASTTTDPSGNFTVSVAMPGPVRLRFVDSTGMHGTVWHGGTDVSNATDIVPGWLGTTPNVSVAMPLVQAGSITGLVGDWYTSAPIAGVDAELYLSSGAYVASAKTDAAGRYRFAGLAPGKYRLYFEDPSGRYFSQWWDYEEEFSSADDVLVSSTVAVTVSPLMDPLDFNWNPLFGPASVSPGSTAQPYAQQPVNIRATLTDLNSGYPLSWLWPWVQSSNDGVTWKTEEGIWVDQLSNGVYQAQVVVGSLSRKYYRFALLPDEWLALQAYSPAVAITPHAGTTSWTGTFEQGTRTSSIYAANGEAVQIEGVLRDYYGNPIDGVAITVYGSSDGNVYAPESGAIAYNAGGGVYRAVVSVGPYKRYFRFVSAKKGYHDASSSPPMSITPRSASGALCRTIAGKNRIGTAIAASQAAFPNGAPAAVLATAYNWPDALGGAALAAAKGGPILLVNQNSVPSEVLAELRRLGVKDLVVLGLDGAISTDVVDALRAEYGVSHVQRLGGKDRYETSKWVARETLYALGKDYDGTCFVASGANFPDALGASPLAAAKGWPLILTPQTGLRAGTLGILSESKVRKVLILGGTGAVSAAVERDLAEYAPERLAGPNRYATATAIAFYGVTKAGLTWDRLALATGENFPDALAGGVMQGKANSVMLLTPGRTLHASPASVLKQYKNRVNRMYFLGSDGAISRSVKNEVDALLR